MDLNIKKQKLSYDELWQEVSAQQSVETDITLPDYCSDIKRILKCAMVPGITNVSVAGENISATGAVSIRLIYLNEKDRVDCYEGNADIKFFTTVKDMPDNAVVSVRAKPNYVNCRAVSQRKITTEGNMAAIFSIYKDCNVLLPESADGSGLQCRKRSTEYESLICRKEKVFDMGETAKVPQGKSPVGKILSLSARAEVDSVKAVTDKLLIKGQLHTDVLYLSETEEGRIEKLRHTMPISQIIDATGAGENSDCTVTVKVRHINAQRKADSSSQGNMIDIAAKCSAMIRCTQKAEITVCDDCYSTSHDIKCDYTIQEFARPVYRMNEQKTSIVVAQIDSGDIMAVTDVVCNDFSFEVKGKQDKVKAKCNVLLGILYTDSKGAACYTEKNAEFEIGCSLKDSYEHLRCSADIQPRDIEWRITAADKIEIKIKSGVLCDVYACESMRVISDIQVLGESSASADNTALTLYFADENEEIWEIAKRYNTTAEAIETENGINGTCTEKQGMLLIPCAG